MKTILVINALNGSIPLVLREKYPSAKITCAEVFPFFKDHLMRLGFEVVDWDEVGLMKFDLVIGNPPYGKNSNLAVKILNKSAEISDTIHFVLPRTFRKASILNRVTPCLHLVEDKTLLDEYFPDSIQTCYQVWHKKDQSRELIKTTTQHMDFEFTTRDQANICVGRVGVGPCGKVFFDKFDKRSENSHYFIKVSQGNVIEVFKILSPRFRQAGMETVGVPSLSKNEIINIYNEYMNHR